MGTFQLVGFSNVIVVGGRGNTTPPTQGWCDDFSGDSTNATLLHPEGTLAYFGPAGLVPFTASLTWGIDSISPIFLLNGTNQVDWHHLPPNTVFTAININIGIITIDSLGAGGTFRFICSPYDSGPITFPPGSISAINQNINPGVSYTPLQILNLTASLSFSGTSIFGSSAKYLETAIIIINGTYTSTNYQWTLTPNVNIKSGSKVTITDTNSGLSIAQIDIQYFDSNNIIHNFTVLAQDFISNSLGQVVFYLPQIGNPPPGATVYVYGIGDGTQFTGAVLAGTFTYSFVDASGIYQLITNKSADTIYDRSSSGATIDVAIPNPFIKTGFLP